MPKTFEASCEAATVSFPVPFLLEMGSAETVQDLLDTVSAWVSHIIPSARCSVALLDDCEHPCEDQHVKVYALTGNAAIPMGQPLPVAGSNPGHAITSRQPVIVPDLRACTAIEAPMLLAGGLNSCVACPLVSGRYCFGSLNVGHQDRNRYDERDIGQLQGIASWIANHLRMTRQIEQLTTQARTDYLTGTLNRHAFTEVSTTLFDQFRRGNTTFGLALLDLDHFKRINDDFGHKAGDEVLIGVAARIEERLRSSDVFARIGGEEFALLFSGIEGAAAMATAADYRALIADRPFDFDGFPHPVTVSIGVTCPMSRDGSFDQMMSRADRLLYDAKANGRNRIEFG